jgi:hypothetical protein
MKKIMFIGLLLASISLKSQDSVYVVKVVDDMSDDSFYTPSKNMVCATTDKKTGISLSVFFDEKNDELTIAEIKVVMINIGNCVENNELIILFENEEKIKLMSWNKFNCDGDAWFRLNDDQRELLAKNRIKKIKITNGRTYESYTHELKTNKDYFNQLFFAAQNGKIKEEKIK